MKRKYKKFLICTLIYSLITGAIPVSANTSSNNADESNSLFTTDTATTDFTVDINSTFRLVIPKKITLYSTDDNVYAASFETTMLESDLRPTEQVAVVTDNFLEFKRENTSNTTDINIDLDNSENEYQTELIFSGVNKDKTYTGYINAGKLSAGNWEGVMDYTVVLDDITKKLSLTSANDVATSENVIANSGSTTDITMMYDGKNVAEDCSYTSDNSNISVKNGIISVSEDAANGETANITATYNTLKSQNDEVSLLEKLGLVERVYASTIKTFKFIVQVCDISVLNSGSSQIKEISAASGDSIDLYANVLGTENGIVNWSLTDKSAASIIKDETKNSIKMIIDENYEGCFDLIADYGTYKKTIPVKVHTHIGDTPVKENIVSSTCTKEGSYDEVTYCSICNKELSRIKKTTECIAHNYVASGNYSAGCTTTGLTGRTVCSVCGAVGNEGTVTPALGHTGGTATCTTLATCSRCGSSYGSYGSHSFYSWNNYYFWYACSTGNTSNSEFNRVHYNATKETNLVPTMCDVQCCSLCGKYLITPSRDIDSHSISNSSVLLDSIEFENKKVTNTVLTNNKIGITSSYTTTISYNTNTDKAVFSNGIPFEYTLNNSSNNSASITLYWDYIMNGRYYRRYYWFDDGHVNLPFTSSDYSSSSTVYSRTFNNMIIEITRKSKAHCTYNISYYTKYGDSDSITITSDDFAENSSDSSPEYSETVAKKIIAGKEGCSTSDIRNLYYNYSVNYYTNTYTLKITR